MIRKFLKKILNKNWGEKRSTQWKLDDGDNTLRLFYDLSPESIVVDVGGYKGHWASEIYSIHQSNIYIFEPVKEFYKLIEKKFSKNPKIKVYNCGFSDKNKYEEIQISGNSSSIYSDNNSQKEKIQLIRFVDFIRENEIEGIELLKINIEGEEYNLLDDILNENIQGKIKNFQVQFHDFIPNAEKRMKNIQNRLSITHKLTYQYPFVWENWQLKK